MELLVNALVLIAKLLAGGFVAWGGWLSLRALRGSRSAAPLAREGAQAGNFERVASLVLLALLCTTLAGLA